MKKKYFILSFLLLLFLVTGGSLSINVSTAFAEPSVTNINPKDGACITQLSPAIIVTFSEAMEPNSVLGSFSLSPAVDMTRVPDAANTVFTFTPTASLTVGTRYTVTITTAAINASGVALSTVFTSTFQPNTSCVPRVISHSPVDGGNIAAAGVITAAFSTSMDAATINKNTFTVTASGSPVSGDVTMDSTSTVATFKPSASLALDTTYIATISKTAQSTSGTSMTDDVTWTFTANDSNFQNTGVGCFIATAAYGSYLDPHVKVLRAFRDKYLLTNAPGSMFVSFYYDHSPAVAEFIARHEPLRFLTRSLLTPVVYVIEYPLGSIFCFIGGILLIYRKKKRGGDHV